MDHRSAQSDWLRSPEPESFAVQFHLLGMVPFDQCWRLQQRLVYEVSGREDGGIVVLLCEHPWCISVGRSGSRGHISLTSEQLRQRHLSVRWVSRGGGCVLHGPGQLAVYPIVPLPWHRWTVGEYLRRFVMALQDTLEQLGVRPQREDNQIGLWGRSGQLVHWGISVRNWTTSQGAFINVNPQMTNYPFVNIADPLELGFRRKATMGSLFAERRQAMTMPKVRATLIPQLASALGTERYHLITGHPLLSRAERSQHEARNRAS